MTTAHKRLTDHHVVAGRVSAKSCPIVSNDIHVVQQLALDCLEHEDVTLQLALELRLILLHFLQILLRGCHKFAAVKSLTLGAVDEDMHAFRRLVDTGEVVDTGTVKTSIVVRRIKGARVGVRGRIHPVVSSLRG